MDSECILTTIFAILILLIGLKLLFSTRKIQESDVRSYDRFPGWYRKVFLMESRDRILSSSYTFRLRITGIAFIVYSIMQLLYCLLDKSKQ